MDPQSNKEFQERLDTMRNYWGKLANDNNDNDNHNDEDSKEDTEAPKCKIVDVQTKVEDVIKKFETKEEKESEKPESIVQSTKQIFEPKIHQDKSEKMSTFVKESCTFFENPYFEKHRFNSNQFESLNPNIVEIIEKEDNMQKKPVTKTKSLNNEPEFDHIRYRVMKSDLFQKNIFANCQKESQFDGLMQYLQDYSFQELLIDNNIVIIEPIRTNVQHETAANAKTARNITKLLHKSHNGSPPNQNTGLRRRFFYHPVRVNREMNEDELPNPDTVKQVRQFFECGLKKSQSSQELDKLSRKTVQYQTLDPDKDNCSATDSSSNPSNSSEIGSNDNLYDNELCCEQQYVSEDVLQKIRECGTSVTYYGGKVLSIRNGDNNISLNPMTRTIMEEIKGNQVRECNCKRSGDSRKNSISDCNNKHENSNNHNRNNNKETYHGIKFKLLKSNSCSSRLELVGTENLTEYKQKFLEKQKYLIDQKNRENQRKNSIINEKEENYTETTTIEVTTSKEEIINKQENGPKIISATGKKMIQWGSSSEEKTYNNINFNKSNQKTNYDFHNYEKIKTNTKKINDMEFEPYEIA
ncbi:hypothetical protein ILUMI_02661 [Ignelater luminosus]|uniref:Uncharacterized protein n=1 Tax=Ignelater luminosus TaxID=2038154 RepID=A0A8K0GMZ3_IGNLU|nr:hypothetical protein ILUMI_02661 [Ignelater luminosus]